MVVNKIKQGDTKSYELVFKQHYNAMFGYSLRLVSDREVAKELVNDTFIQLWNKRHTLDSNVGSLKPFLFRILHNKSINYLKREKTCNVSLDDPLFFIEPTACSYSQQNLDELSRSIHAAIDKLPMERRRIFTMSRIQEMKYQEIADELGISKKTVENQIGRALHFLRDELKSLKK